MAITTTIPVSSCNLMLFLTGLEISCSFRHIKAFQQTQIHFELWIKRTVGKQSPEEFFSFRRFLSKRLVFFLFWWFLIKSHVLFFEIFWPESFIQYQFFELFPYDVCLVWFPPECAFSCLILPRLRSQSKFFISIWVRQQQTILDQQVVRVFPTTFFPLDGVFCIELQMHSKYELGELRWWRWYRVLVFKAEEPGLIQMVWKDGQKSFNDQFRTFSQKGKNRGRQHAFVAFAALRENEREKDWKKEKEGES